MTATAHEYGKLSRADQGGAPDWGRTVKTRVLVLVVGVVAALGGGSFLDAAVAAGPVACGPQSGAPTAGSDVLHGSSVSESIYGLEGNDVIYGRGGDDCLLGDEGDDTIYGGAGHDYLGGDSGNDVLHGEAGDDSITLGPGSDIAYGGDGQDSVYAIGGEVDYVYCGAGIDDVRVDPQDYYFDCENVSFEPISKG